MGHEYTFSGRELGNPAKLFARVLGREGMRIGSFAQEEEVCLGRDAITGIADSFGNRFGANDE